MPSSWRSEKSVDTEFDPPGFTEGDALSAPEIQAAEARPVDVGCKFLDRVRGGA
jgi:hypothetical protein